MLGSCIITADISQIYLCPFRAQIRGVSHSLQDKNLTMRVRVIFGVLPSSGWLNVIHTQYRLAEMVEISLE